MSIIWLLSVSINWRCQSKSWAESQPVIAATLIGFLGLGAYTVYRMVLWTIVDGLVWLAGWSAPSLHRRSDINCLQISYSNPYAWFLSWRYGQQKEPASGSQQTPGLSDYLHYRWASVHFTTICSIAVAIACQFCHSESILYANAYWVIIISAFCIILSGWQLAFLFRVERDLMYAHEEPPHSEIEKLAHQRWVFEGKPLGRDREHWQWAREQLRWRRRDAIKEEKICTINPPSTR